ncbi:WD40 repeat domain-containing protein [Terrarubrum flagellatum]|uniref:WD40 repeat domain-containing protein n=1 Tax=Terrirubrum flagellatum TaxID=2895980 RepID=UPI0031453C99
MSTTIPTRPPESLTKNVEAIEASAHVVGAAFLGDVGALALADGRVLLRDAEGAISDVAAHPDAGLLSFASDGKSLVTGGDDGRVVATSAKGEANEIADEKSKWIDAVATNGDGAIAWSAGRSVKARDGKGKIKQWAPPSSVRGLVFAPKGYRLGVAHNNGASLWFPNTDAKPDLLEWKGSHLDIMWSPNGRFVVTSMQENQLHGWGLPEKQHMRMSGYPGKTRSMSWSHDGLWLATSGADAVIIWPFQGEKGPMGKPPRECGVRPAKVTSVAFHPKALVVAAGYDDGCILLCRLTDASELLVRPAGKEGGAISALAWDANGRRMLFGSREGAAGLLTLPV